jgi:hypothetical protein
LFVRSTETEIVGWAIQWRSFILLDQSQQTIVCWLRWTGDIVK